MTSSDHQDAHSQWGNVFRVQLLLLLGLLVYVGAMWAVQAIWGTGKAQLSWVPAICLVLVPAIIWIVYFYLLDHRQPEPTHYVLSAFLLGALVAEPASSAVINDLFEVNRWMTLEPFTAHHISALFLVVGTAQELSKYLVIRYTIYLSDEFDQPADGIVYMTSAGIGFAAALNLDYVSSGVLLGMGAINITITTLAHACFAGVMGFALGRTKFDTRAGANTLVVGLLAAITLNGAFGLLQDVPLSAWGSLLLSGLFAAVVFAAILVLMRLTLEPRQAPPVEEGG